MARGHRVTNVEEIPVVVSDDVQAFQRTKEALALLKALGLDEDTAEDIRLTRRNLSKWISEQTEKLVIK